MDLKKLLLYTLLFAAFFAKAQDTVYFLDGSSKAGKITEVGPEYVTIDTPGRTETFSKDNILLIAFKNGTAEVITRPQTSLVYNPASSEEIREQPQPGSGPENINLGSVNALALCNADIAGFYEHILPHKKIGLGVMGAYNFNLYATASNLFIAVLDNAKKKYDLGLFANLYAGGYQKEGTSFYFGTMIKYMSFDFTRVTEEKVKVGSTVSTNIKYSAASGSQLSTLFTCGTHSNLNNNFFIRSLVGLGGFTMRGTYKEQYNYHLNKANQSSTNPDPVTYNRSFLLKFYIGLNLGFTF